MASVTQLNLSSVRGFTQAVDWIRKNILLKHQSERAAAVDVKLALRTSSGFGLITVFLDTMNGYLFAFKGRDKVYILRDDSQEEYKALLTKIGTGAVTVLNSVASDHRSFGTFLPNKETGGMRGRSYALSHLQDAARLGDFSDSSGPVTESDVAQAISVLVCMIAECARWPRIEHEFEKIYFGENVKADEVFKVYDKAKRLRRFADVFPHYLLSDRIEKLVKRSDDLRQLLASMRTKAGIANLDDKALIELCLKSPQSNPGGDKNSAERVRTIQREFKVDAKAMAEILSLCANKAAVHAAQSGVVG